MVVDAKRRVNECGLNSYSEQRRAQLMWRNNERDIYTHIQGVLKNIGAKI